MRRSALRSFSFFSRSRSTGRRDAPLTGDAWATGAKAKAESASDTRTALMEGMLNGRVGCEGELSRKGEETGGRLDVEHSEREEGHGRLESTRA